MRPREIKFFEREIKSGRTAEFDCNALRNRQFERSSGGTPLIDVRLKSVQIIEQRQAMHGAIPPWSIECWPTTITGFVDLRLASIDEAQVRQRRQRRIGHALFDSFRECRVVRLPLLDCAEELVGADAIMPQDDGLLERIVAGALDIGKAQAFGLVCNNIPVQF